MQRRTESLNSATKTFTILLLVIASGVSGQDANSLRDLAHNRAFYIGPAVAMGPLRREPAYQDTLKREFNICVAENAFKFDATEPAPNSFNFADTDYLVAFAQTSGMMIRGHTLVWHNQLPGWLTSGTWTRDQAIAIMRNHIFTLVGRYKGRIAAWDVVNEAIDDSGSLRTTSFWHRTVGPDYIKLAFQFAHEADPNAVLYYNDYSIEDMGRKATAVYNLVSDLLGQGVPIHGVGWQAHFVEGWRVSAAHYQNAQRLASLGLEISITEMDVRLTTPATAAQLASQATSYQDAMTFCLSQLNCRALVMWGFTDKHSWIPSVFAGRGEALIFDANYQPKPAYTAIRNVLQTAPFGSMITSPEMATGTVGTAFTYSIIASPMPSSYGALGLPPGLSVNPMTGVITGTPTAPGTTDVTLLAITADSVGRKRLTLTIADQAGISKLR